MNIYIWWIYTRWLANCFVVHAYATAHAPLQAAHAHAPPCPASSASCPPPAPSPRRLYSILRSQNGIVLAIPLESRIEAGTRLHSGGLILSPTILDALSNILWKHITCLLLARAAPISSAHARTKPVPTWATCQWLRGTDLYTYSYIHIAIYICVCPYESYICIYTYICRTYTS